MRRSWRAHVIQAVFLRIQVIADCAAATRWLALIRKCPAGSARGPRTRWCRAPIPAAHSLPAPAWCVHDARRPLRGVGAAGTCPASSPGSNGRSQAPEGQQQTKGRGAAAPCADAALHALARAALDLFFGDAAADIHQAPVLHTGRAGRFAGTAGKATIQVQHASVGYRCAFEHLLDQVDASARAVQFVAQQLISGTGRGAEAAMHARAQDGLRLQPVGRASDGIEQIGLHDVQSSRYMRPGLKMPCGSKERFKR